MKKTKHNIHKEIMYNKIMPSSLAVKQPETDTNVYSESDIGDYNNLFKTSPKQAEDISAFSTDIKTVHNPAMDYSAPVIKKEMNKFDASPSYYGESPDAPSLVFTPKHKEISESRNPSENTVSNDNSAADDDRTLINLSEKMLMRKLLPSMQKFKCCECDKCVRSVKLMILNSITPKYIVVHESELENLLDNQNYSEINRLIVQAIISLKANPLHK